MRLLCITFLLTLATGCSDPSRPEVPLAIQAAGGANQSGPVGTPLPQPLTVTVTRSGEPVSGVRVRWIATQGSVSDTASNTDALGHAAASWTLGTVTGPQQARAEITQSTGQTVIVSFTAQALPGPISVLRISGDSVRLVAAGTVSTLQLIATDAFGNAIPGLTNVQWTSSDPATATVNNSGQVQALQRGSAQVAVSAGAHTAVVQFEVHEVLFEDRPVAALTVSQRHMETRAADFDGDGDLDLIVAREFQPNLLLLNDGQGNFTDASIQIPQKVRDSEDIAVADFDGDGDLDIVIASEDDVHNPAIALVHEYYLNNGSALFTDVSARIPVRSESNAVVAGDIDGDGDIDLILSNAGREIVLINDGAGFFADESAARMPPAGDATQDVALGDVDGDGDLDLLVGNDGGGANRLYLNNGQGVFTSPAPNLPLPTGTEVTRNADFADVDGDGDLDIYFSNATYAGGQPQDRLLLNNGAGIFTDVTATHLPHITINSFDAEFVDVDRDGDLDLVLSGNRGNQGGFIYLNTNGHFAEATELTMPFVAGPIVVEVEVADLNGDGRLDLLFSGFDAAHRLLLAR